ncbi:DoxX family protein [Flavobacteriaceae bacterium]|nr:DoxX family protein [Flavobacteriaceae bacterium]MDB4152852.1 DoxX family protein [Flavobacteriaceae bacterium]|tara:strand:+ start:6444 stop:6788 length:345 start_codon:yes stop_codon:yes gene_type:complete
MELITTLSQIIIAVSILIVWVFRFDNIVIEFKQYGLSDLIRSLVGAAKIAMATLLIAGIWYPTLILVPAGVIAFLMLCALYAHFSVRNPMQKYLPAFSLLCLSLFLVAGQLNLL